MSNKIIKILIILAIFMSSLSVSYARRIQEPASFSDIIVEVTKDVIYTYPDLNVEERASEILNRILPYFINNEFQDLKVTRDGDYKLYYVFMLSNIASGANTNFILDAETGDLIEEGFFEKTPPEALNMLEYDFLKSFSAGGSAANTYLAIKRSGDPSSPDRLVVVKYADRHGVDGVGMPVLETQALRLLYLRHLVVAELKNVEGLDEKDIEDINNMFSEVIGYSINQGLYVYYAMPYRPGETLTEYFSGGNIAVDDFIGILDNLLKDVSITLKERDNVEVSLEEGISHTIKWYIEKIERRFELMQQRDGAVFQDSIQGNPVSISNVDYENITYLFEELLAADTITINGQEYPNVPVLIQEIKDSPELLSVIAPAFISRLSHGDLIIRNIYRETSGNIRLIDLKGMDPPDSALDPLYGISKMVFGFGYDLVRDGLYDLEVRRDEDGGFSFDLRFDKSNPIVSRYLEAIVLVKEMIENNREFNNVMSADINWKERLAFSIAAHFIGDLACHLEPDKSGESSLALYAIGTVLLDDFLKHLDIDLELIFH